MEEKKIVVPDGMLEAVGEAIDEARGGINSMRDITLARVKDICLEAALRWWSENPRRPTEQQHMEISGVVRARVEHDDLTMWDFWEEWQRRCFLAPEPEIPDNRLPLTLEECRVLIDEWLKEYQRDGRRLSMVGTSAAKKLLDALHLNPEPAEDTGTTRPDDAEFASWWSSTNNDNWFSNKPINVNTLKETAYFAWRAGRASK